MAQYIEKDRVEEILRCLWKQDDGSNPEHRICYNKALEEVQCKLDTIETIDPYEQCVQYPSIEDGIKAHAETYSFNIESELFNQLTKEQQKLWRKEIEQACISGGNAGVEIARDVRYKENIEAKEVDLVEEIDYKDYIRFFEEHPEYNDGSWGFEETWTFAQYCYKLGLNAWKGE